MGDYTDKVKTKMEDLIENEKNQWIDLALKIHENPELSFEEHKATQWLTEPLEQAGFRVKRHLLPELPTSFFAEWTGTKAGPTIAFIAEYDALAELGHACGHNIIGTSAVSAAVSLKKALDDDLPGKLVVIGTPAEEEGGGKILLVENGWFDDIDAVMMFHPRDKTMIFRGSLACVDVDITFMGKAAHAAANPDQGISALDAMLHSFLAIKQLLPSLPASANVHGIIRKGGDATNIIPDHCEASFLMRAKTREELHSIKRRVYDAVRHSTKAIGASCTMEEGLIYAERINNRVLGYQLMYNLERIGVEVDSSEITTGIGSSDIGNVSQLVPTIHPYIKIGNAITHTPAFTEATKSPEGMAGLIQAAKALALTAFDLFQSPSLIMQAKEELRQTINQRRNRL
ncbi:amidohydrolase [Evansella caseinilytica]|uniref:Peptidase M20 domain-containing protein 2 n=1 Tax=Evansella caseinilytica TaxID=1503961 RepID=A0A1H3GQD6_9BACI|nr:M20 family metallopeptidase [Evansella caseinilytica]SDY05327.1 amidohydrolase [Evansella caseinilytica]